MSYNRAISVEYCLCMNGKMSFLIILGFLIMLSINALCPEDTTNKNLPVVPVTAQISFNEIPRKVIIEALTTGQATKNDDFERTLMTLLLLNLTYPISDNELSLWITALLALRDNPRNQNGIDMVAELLARVGAMSRPRPYLVLTLCNVGAVKREHLEKIVKWNSHRSNYTHNRDLEMDAMLLKTLACAASLPNAKEKNLDFTEFMQEKAKKISFAFTKGYFESVYTTSMVVQAMTAYNLVTDATLQWGEKEALDALRKESSADSITARYYLAMALNARRIPFIKDLYPYSFDTQLTLKRDIHVNLTVKNEEVSEVDFAMQLKVPMKWNLFEIMLRASNFSSRFRFVHSLNKNGEPLITEVDGIPNDPERGIYWMICTTQCTNGFISPSFYYPFDGDHIILWYRSTDCPVV